MSTPDPSGIAAAAAGGGATSQLPMPSEQFMTEMMSSLTLDWTDEDAVVANGVRTWGLLSGSAHPFDEEGAREVTIAEMKRASSYASQQNHVLAIANTPPWRDRLGSLDVPTLVIHGTEDPILPYPHGEAIVAEIPGAKMLTLEGSGHELPRPEWDRIIPAILEHTS